jgi:alkaline phosphatase
MACGVKTNNGMIGMDPEKVSYRSILELLSEKGYRTGLVATSAITHATPAAFASHVKRRNMQVEIAAHQLDNRVDVLFGGGRKFFLPKGTEKGIRKDGRDLLKEAGKMGYQLAGIQEEMLLINQLPALGLFADEGMTTFEPEPSLEEMTRTAIELLSAKDRNLFAAKPRFFLMIEGSQIDWAAHANDTDRVIRQTLLFDMAVREAIEFAKQDKNTLVVVTADHETGGLTLIEKDGVIVAEWTSGSHTAVDVPVYAFGPGSELFSGALDNTEIPNHIAELTDLKEFPVLRKGLEATAEAVVK